MYPQFIDVDDIKVNHIEVGLGEPIVLLHGLGGSWEDWIDNIPVLSKSFRVCAIDIPGFGMSPPPSKRIEYTFEYVASFIRNFMDTKGYTKAYLIGNSMGGGIALRFAIDYPERVHGVIVANAVGIGKEIAWSIRLLSLPGMARLIIPLVSKGQIRETWRSMFTNPKIITDEMIDRTWEWIQKPETRKFLIKLYSEATIIWGQKHIFLPELVNIKCPTLVTWGADDTVLPFTQGVKAYQAIPNSKLHIFRDCGHAPHIEKCQEFNSISVKFLEDCNDNFHKI